MASVARCPHIGQVSVDSVIKRGCLSMAVQPKLAFDMSSRRKSDDDAAFCRNVPVFASCLDVSGLPPLRTVANQSHYPSNRSRFAEVNAVLNFRLS
jgi:hypothetical protein